MDRYSIITEKNPREIVLLRGTGCKWRRCTFCDYHLDSNPDDKANFVLNKVELDKITGIYGKLEVINSGSFSDLDNDTMDHIMNVCISKKISEIHFECHWTDRGAIRPLRSKFAEIGVDVKVKTGVETFDHEYREKVLCKGISENDPAIIAEEFDECCLLFGLAGQTEASMTFDIETALANFDRVCVNIMVRNSTIVKPDESVIANFMTDVAPKYTDNQRIDILIDNTDFGVGGEKNA